MTRFVHLHTHTQYSLLDGINRIDELIGKAETDGMKAVAITDHGNTMGSVEFYKKAHGAGIKPIIGMEAYVAAGGIEHRQKDKHHLVLIAENQQGLRNLRVLETKANLDGFFYKPRVDENMLKEHHQGLIALSGCLAGKIPKLIAADKTDEAIEVAGEYQHIFGPDNFFLEIQDNGLRQQCKVNERLIEIGSKLSIPLVATNDCHYLDRQDAEAHDVMLCIQTKTRVTDPRRLRFGSDQFYFKTQAEMIEAFRENPDAIENTLLIADRCNVQIELDQYHFPRFNADDTFDAASRLRQLARDGLDAILDTPGRTSPAIDAQTYRSRLEYELDTIIEMGFDDYFLIVEDQMRFARQNRIATGPGRGSAAGSLVSYVLGITGIDPVRHGLIFERFLNPQRASMPDIDLDFCVYKRGEILQYLQKRYGSDRVAHIISFGSMKARAALRDVGRALGIDAAEVDKIAKAVPDQAGILLKEALETQPMLKSLVNTRADIARMFRIAQRLEGLHRHGSRHPAGVVISDRPLVEHLALGRSDDGCHCTNLDMKSVEDIGLVKMDVLGLSTLSTMERALELIEQGQQRPADWPDVPLDDPATYRLLCAGQTTGVFQLESDGMKTLLRELQPTCFPDLVALIALYRPGPLGAGMEKDFIDRKHGRQETTYPVPALEPILGETHGVILYQEQVMHIACEIAGYSMGEADLLRRAMGKKNVQAMQDQRQRFVTGACQKGYAQPLAEQLFNQLAHFAGYGFAKSHSAAYALISYQTAFLKANYPLQFMTACLCCADGKTEDIVKFVKECRQMGIGVLPPDVNFSHKGFGIENERIRYGLQAIKHVGEKPVDELLKARKEGPFTQLAHLLQRVNRRAVNTKVIESLIHAGALDSMGYERRMLLEQLDGLAKKRNLRDRVTDARDRAAMESRNEYEVLGLYMGNHPVLHQQALLGALRCTDSSGFANLNPTVQAMVAGTVGRVHDILTRKGKPMCFVDISDDSGVISAVMFPAQYVSYRQLLDQSGILVFRGLVEERKDEKQLIIKWVHTLADTERMNAKSIVVDVEKQTRAESTPALLQILQKHRGKQRVLIHFQDTEANAADELILLNDHLCVDISDDLIEHLHGLAGVKGSRVVYA